MALRAILTGDEPELHKACRPVERVDGPIRSLLQDMADTLHQVPEGGGLAAPQIGVLRRLVVIDLGEGLYQLVNPEIMEEYGSQLSVEGCLSRPGLYGRVFRPQRVVVHALNENGEEVVVHGSGLMAVCLCHEIDHLNGTLFTDKAVSYLPQKK